jgi:HK97 family phage major capsid protein
MGVLSTSSIADLGDEIKRFVSTSGKDIEKLGKAHSSALEKIDLLDTALIDMRLKHDDVLRRADDLERRLNEKARFGGSMERERFADVLASKQSFASVRTLGRGDKVNIEMATKDILGLGPQLPMVAAQIAGGPEFMYGVRSLIPSQGTTSGAISFLRETAFTDNADVVAEGQPKPKSEKTFLKVVVPIETIAHFFKVSKQSYDDVAGLAVEIESNLISGLERKVEQQLLKGTGTSPQLQGLYPLATAATAVTGTPTIIDVLISATTELAMRGYRATGIVMSPADVGAMALLKDTTGRYLLNATPPIPRIVSSPIMAAGEWLIGDFSKARLFMREESNIQVASQNVDDFERNLLTVLGEVRLGLAVYQAAAFIKNGAPVGTAASRK